MVAETCVVIERRWWEKLCVGHGVSFAFEI